MHLARAYLRYYRLSLLVLAVVTALLILAVPYAIWRDTQAATGWAAPWQSVAEVGANWQTVGAPCYSVTPGRLRLTCQSAGLVTRQAWSRQFPITVTASVSASAAIGPRYFGGLTIYDLDSGDTAYGEIALASGVPPFQNTTGDQAGVLVNDGLYWHAPVNAGWHALQVVYLPAGQYKLYLDGALVNTVTPWRPLQRDPVIFILCVSVGENTPDDGSLARCDFGPVTVTGAPSGTVATAYFPRISNGQGYP